MAGRDVAVRRFPFRIGRAPEAELRLEEPGVWDRHLEIQFARGQGFTFAAQPEALTLINHEPAAEGVLRNGDTIELGAARLRFWLARARQTTLRVREALTWTALFALWAAQAAIIVWLLR